MPLGVNCNKPRRGRWRAGCWNRSVGASCQRTEGGEKARLLVDCKELYRTGMTDDEILAATDEVSDMVMENMTSEYSIDEPGLIRLAIG